MYTQYFGLTKPPFKITPDPEFFFSGGNRGAVLDALLYAISNGEGIVKVVGEVGSGKTMLCRMLERELPDDCDIIYLANPRLSPDEVLHAIAIELRLPAHRTNSKVQLSRLVQHHLLQKHAKNRKVVMFIEEAQGMRFDTLEEIRMLSNLETTQDKLLQIVMFGQPELDEKLRDHDIRQLKERITYAFELGALNRQEIRDYINTRIRASGYRGGELFTPAAIRTLKSYSKGLLRRINILADKALLAAFSKGEREIKPRHIRMAAKDSEFRTGTRRWRFASALFAGLFAAVIAGGILLWPSVEAPVQNLWRSLSGEALAFWEIRPDSRTVGNFDESSLKYTSFVANFAESAESVINIEALLSGAREVFEVDSESLDLAHSDDIDVKLEDFSLIALTGDASDPIAASE